MIHESAANLNTIVSVDGVVAELPHRLEHPVTATSRRRDRLEHRLVDQLRQSVRDIQGIQFVERQHVLGGRTGEASRKDACETEQLLQPIVQYLVRPTNGGA